MTERESDTYRRGLSLGLTMAEIFILILFLLLLVLLALYAFNAETEKNLQVVKSKLVATENDLDKARRFIPADIQHIIRDNELLKNGIKEVKKENATIAERLKTADDQQVQLERELNTMKDVREFIYDNQRPGESLADTVERLQNTYRGNDEIHEENSRLHAENARLRTEFGDKGIDPPCWYQVTTREGERHESPYYLMDIAVHNEHLKIRVPNNAPHGYAIDEGGQPAVTSYQQEYEKLPLPPAGIIEPISLKQFAEITEPIKRMGKNEQIRDYACVFYVRVWDFTPETAKTRWKEAEDTIKESFYTYRVKNDPWTPRGNRNESENKP